MFPASTTKIMTALVVLKSGLSLDKIVTVGPNAAQTGESSIYLQVGERFSVRQLLQAALVKSANDACVALAEAVSGDVAAFVARMNAQAKALNCRDTHFMNPHGLHDANHYTSAFDLACIARAATQLPDFNAIVRAPEVHLPGNTGIGPTRVLMNRNRLLWRWSACDGVKTGYTREAGRCLVASATVSKNGQPWRLLSVVMRSPDVWSDSANLLLHHGFEEFAPTIVLRKGAGAGRVEAARGAFATQAIVARDLQLPLRSGESRALEKRVKLFPRVAPLRRGQRVGTLELRARGEWLASVPLIAREAVPARRGAQLSSTSGRNLWKEPLRRAEWSALLVTLCAGSGALLLLRKRHDTRKRIRKPKTRS